MKLLWTALEGKKNYLFAAGLFAIGLWNAAMPDKAITIMDMSSPQSYFAAATGWALMRNAIAKVQPPATK